MTLIDDQSAAPSGCRMPAFHVAPSREGFILATYDHGISIARAGFYRGPTGAPIRIRMSNLPRSVLIMMQPPSAISMTRASRLEMLRRIRWESIRADIAETELIEPAVR
jgi:hypothetical protein